MKLTDLIQDDKNFNKGSKKGSKLMEKSFEKFKAGRSMLHPDYLHPVSQMQPSTGKILKAYRSLEPKEIIDLISALSELKKNIKKDESKKTWALAITERNI